VVNGNDRTSRKGLIDMRKQNCIGALFPTHGVTEALGIKRDHNEGRFLPEYPECRRRQLCPG